MARRAGRSTQPFSASTTNPTSSKSKGKAQSGPTRPNKRDEAYTYMPQLPKHHRTSAHQLSLTKEEAKAGPSRRRHGQGEDGEDEEEDMEERIRKVAMMIADDEGLGEVDSEESSVDSDEAWEEEGSDEERWGDVFRDLDSGKVKGKGKKAGKEVVRKAAKPLTVNLDESEDEAPSKKANGTVTAKGKGKGKMAAEPTTESEEDEVEEEEVDSEDESALLDEDDEVNEFELDMQQDAESGSDGDLEKDEDEDDEEDAEGSDAEGNAEVESDDESIDIGDEDEDEDEDEEEGDDDEDDPELPSDLSEDDEQLEGDLSTLEGLDAFVDRIATGDKKGKDGKEGEKSKVEGSKKRKILPMMSAPSLDDNEFKLKSDGKVDIAKLIASNPSLASAAALLTPTSSSSKAKSTSVLKQGVVPAPLPTTVQDRIAREAAYEQTKEEGAKWAGLMKRVKEAEHLSFPLQAQYRGGVKSSGELLAGYKPQSSMESAVQTLLNKANLTEDGITKRENEALEGQDLSIEEIEARRAAMRQQRELMFRAEARAKRVSKIKSKTFRKLARKRAARAGQNGEIDEEALDRMDVEEADELREKMERERARERATLKHGARTSRWAREHGFVDDDKRKAKEEMLDMKARLSRKIAGKGDQSSEEGSEDNSEGDEDDEDDIRTRAFEQLDKVDKAGLGAEKEGGLMGMAFMKKAQERRMRQSKEDEDALRRDIEMFGGESSGAEEDDGDEEGGEASMMKIGGNEGRMVFSGSAATGIAKTSKSGIQSNGAVTAPLVANGISNATTKNTRASHAQLPESGNDIEESEPASNPWLTASSSAGPSRKRNQGLNANSSAADKSVASLKKAKRNRDAEEDDEAVEIDLNPSITAPGSTNGSGKSKASKSILKMSTTNGDDGEELNGDEEGTGMMPRRKTVAFGQRDLVAEAFAGDNVVEDFVAEKARIEEQDAPKTMDTSLPGWGSWGGKGAKKRKTNPKFLVTKPGIDVATRKDFNRNNVIISEKKDKKASVFQVKDLPYPYTSVAQYERRFDNPLGNEWNSRATHQKDTLPRVVKKPGAIIEPVRRLF